MKKQVVKYLPVNLNLAQFLEVNKPAFKFELEKFIYILSLINELPVYNRKNRNAEGFVRLNAKTFQDNGLRDYKRYIDYLIEQSIIESDNYYVIGQKSKAYRFTDKYRNQKIKPCILPEGVKFIIVKTAITLEASRQVPHLVKWLNPYKIQIDKPTADYFILEQFESDDSSKRYNRYNQRRISIDKINEGELFASIDSKAGRLHTNFTNLSKDLKQFIKYDDKKLVSLDINNSQPLISSLLLEESFYNKNKKQESTSSFHYNNFQINKPSLTIMLSRIKQISNYQDVKYYKDIVRNEDFYSVIQEIFLDRGLITKDVSRDEMKPLMFNVLYSDNRFFHQKEAEAKRIFREVFPNVYDFFKLIKQGDNSRLPILLQAIESELILYRITKRVHKENRHIPLFTIHDSVCTWSGYEGLLSEVMQSEIIKAFGFEGRFKIEAW